VSSSGGMAQELVIYSAPNSRASPTSIMIPTGHKGVSIRGSELCTDGTTFAACLSANPSGTFKTIATMSNP
jgi:hypothetical protein